jgi:DNA-binding CsgD family transcriptional regulator
LPLRSQAFAIAEDEVVKLKAFHVQGMTSEEIGSRLKRATSTISNKLRALQLKPNAVMRVPGEGWTSEEIDILMKDLAATGGIMTTRLYDLALKLPGRSQAAISKRLNAVRRGTGTLSKKPPRVWVRADEDSLRDWCALRARGEVAPSVDEIAMRLGRSPRSVHMRLYHIWRREDAAKATGC